MCFYSADVFIFSRNNVNVLIRATEKSIDSCDLFKYELQLLDTVSQYILVGLNDHLFTPTHVFVTVNLISVEGKHLEHAQTLRLKRQLHLLLIYIYLNKTFCCI